MGLVVVGPTIVLNLKIIVFLIIIAFYGQIAFLISYKINFQ